MSRPAESSAGESSTSQDEPMVPEEEDTFSDLPEDVLTLSVEEINARTRMIDNEVKVCPYVALIRAFLMERS